MFLHNMLMVQKFHKKRNVGAASAPRVWAEENEPGRLVYVDAASGRVAACTVTARQNGAWKHSHIGAAREHQMSCLLWD